jgi:hypothetical protein
MNIETLGGFFENLSSMHTIAVPFAKTFVLYGLGFSIGKNIVKVMRNRIRMSVAIADIARDSIIAFFIGYVIGAMGVGRFISNSFDAAGKILSQTLGSNSAVFISDPVNVFLGLLYAMGADFGSVTILALTAPAVVLGALIGAIFGFLFN